MKRLIFLIFSFAFTAASAQTKHIVERKGLVIGASLGAAYAWHRFPSGTQHSFDFALELKAGYMVSSRTAILLSSHVTGYDYSGMGRPRKRDFGVVTATVQYWIKDRRIWILGGAGLGIDAPVFFDIRDPKNAPSETSYYTGYGFVLGAGNEMIQGKHYAIDVKARCMFRNVRLEEGRCTGISPGLLVGISLY